MENNEVLFQENDVLEVVEGIAESDTAGGGLAKTIVVGAAALLTTLGVVAYKKRNKIDEWRIKRLEKKGYAVYKPQDAEEQQEAYYETKCDEHKE